MVEWSVEFGKR